MTWKDLMVSDNKQALLRYIEALDLENVQMEAETEIVREGNPPIEVGPFRQMRQTGRVTITIVGTTELYQP